MSESVRKIVVVVAITATCLLAQRHAFAQNLLLVTANNGSLTSQEQARETQFIAWGYTVSTVWSGDSQAAFDAALVGMDVVYVPEEVFSGDVDYKLRETTVGVVNDEPCLADEFGFTTTCSASVGNYDTLTITNNSHPITSSFSIGDVVILDQAEPAYTLSGTFASGLTSLGDWGSGVGLAVLETGATLSNTYNGSNTAFGRRVILGFGGSFDFNELNANGLSLIQQALIWASGNAATLKGHWILNETSGTTAVDSSTSGFDGTYENGVTLAQEGPTPCGDSAAEFDGIDEYVDLPDMNLDYSQGCSFAFWFRPHATPATYSALLGISNGQDVDDIWIGWIPGTGIELYLTDTTDGSGYTYLDDNLDPTLDVWQHFVATIDSSGNATMYRDGVAIATGYVSLPDNVNRTQNSIGVSVWNDEFEGRMQDVRVYTRELSAGEVSELYSLIGHWNLDETTGTTAADESGFSNDGTLANGPVWTTGEVDGGLQFDGIDDSVQIPDNPAYSSHANGNGITVAAWVQVLAFDTDSHGQTRQPIVAKGLSSGGWEWALYVYDNGAAGFSTWRDGTGSSHSEISGGTLVVGQWAHVAATFESGVANRVYIDGVEVALGTAFTGNAYDGDRPVLIGSREDGQHLNAIIDDVRIYNRVLCPGEIDALTGDNSSDTVRIMQFVEVANP